MKLAPELFTINRQPEFITPFVSVFLAMIKETKQNLRQEYQDFLQLDYFDKLAYFDLHFTIIPYTFPRFDIKLSCLRDDIRLTQLVENFYKEGRSRHIYETQVEEDGSVLSFDIRPTSFMQRIQYNKYILGKFLKEKESIKNHFQDELMNVNDQDKCINARINEIHSVIEWVVQSIRNLKTRFSLQNQFLKVFYSGFKAYQNGKEESGRIRKKFVEIFLYSQGVLLADHVRWLEHLLEKNRNNPSNNISQNLRLKIELLHKLGVIDFLLENVNEKDKNNHTHLAELIYLITSESQNNQVNIHAYLSFPNNETGLKHLQDKNINSVLRILDSLPLSAK